MMKTGISTKTNSFPPTYKNPNGCPIHGTFYVSHQYTNYAMVQKLCNQDMPKLKRLYIAGEGECGGSRIGEFLWRGRVLVVPSETVPMEGSGRNDMACHDI